VQDFRPGGDIEAVDVLHDPRRRALFAYVSRQPHDVSRDEAARAVSISRGLAAFHLDRLVDAELLEVSYRRLTPRQRPGAGRPSKLYRRSKRQIDITLPGRRYELLAQLLAGSLREAGDSRTESRLANAARALGGALANSYRSGRRPTTRGSVRQLRQVLDRLGAEPYSEGAVVRLRNCPFDTVAATYPELVCHANLSLVEGMIEHLGVNSVEARLEPRPGECCVAVVQSSAKGGSNA